MAQDARPEREGSFILLPRADGSSPVPLYLQVRTIVAEAIRKGLLAPARQLPSTDRLAKQLGVSMLTAHRGLQQLAAEGWVVRGRGHCTLVRADYQSALAHTPRFRICLATPRKAGLHEDTGGQAASGTKGLNTGGQAASGAERGVWGCLAGLQEAAGQIAPPTERIVLNYESAEELTHVKADGFVCVQPATTDIPELERIARAKSLVVAGPLPSGTRLHGIEAGHEAGARAAVRHLAQLGHQRIALVAGLSQDLAWQQRLSGFMLEMGAAGLAVGETAIVFEGSRRATSLENQLTRLLHGPQAPTAIIAGDLRCALRVSAQVQQMGLSIPRDVSLIGFGDDWFAGLLNPPLTVVAEPTEEMTRLAFSRLLQLLTGQPAAVDTDPLPTTLIVRGTTAAVRTEAKTGSSLSNRIGRKARRPQVAPQLQGK